MKKTNLSYSFNMNISVAEKDLSEENKEYFFRKSCKDIIDKMDIEDLKKFFKNIEAVPEPNDWDNVDGVLTPTHAIYRFNTSIEIPD